ncbi:MAG: alanine racemase [Flavobacteriaceae bacterium]
MPKAAETVLEIDFKALEHNYHYLCSKISQTTKFMAVVKAFAYGSDAIRIAQRLEALGVDYFAVAYVKEGVALRNAGIKTPILVLHPQPVNFELLITHTLEPSLYSPNILKQFLAVAKSKALKFYPVHIKFNTGLNRLGFWENDVDFIKEQLHENEFLKPISVFSHLAASEDLSERPFSEAQIASFSKTAAEIENVFGPSLLKHMLNTSGILNYPQAQFNMVRSGIGLYGFGNDPLIDAQLKPIATLKTIISQIHKIEPNESVGYNRAYKADHFKTTATLPVGHADGIGRHYGNGKGFVYVNGKKAFIIGNVCMDMIMIDITGMECKEGDEVIIFGQRHSAEHMANAANTISYELLTGISSRVPRVFLD